MGEIISRFEKKGFKLTGLKLFHCSKELAEVCSFFNTWFFLYIIMYYVQLLFLVVGICVMFKFKFKRILIVLVI